MKLRIRGNSIRVRLTQSEVARVAAEGSIEESTVFSDEQQLTYAIRMSDKVGAISASFRANRITIQANEETVKRWSESDEVGIEGTQSAGNGKLRILIEKDFACLKPRNGEDDADTFDNPLGANKSG